MAKTIDDTGFQKIVPQAEVVDTRTGKDLGAYGAVEMVNGKEEAPCCMCKSFEDTDPAKLVRFVVARGLTMRADGKLDMPIKNDFKKEKRANMVFDPKGSGLCRRDVIPVEALATCENWQPTRTISEFQQRFRK
jgi:hypothetical protein